VLDRLMGLRAWLNEQNPKIVGGVVAALVVLVIFIIVYATKSGPSTTVNVATSAFFSTDDGKTWFTADAAKLAPFTVDGKTAVRAYVFTCADAKPFVGFLERYTAEGKKAQEALNMPGGKNAMAMLDQATGLEIKKPGQPVWVKQSDRSKADPIMNITCKDGSTPKLVRP
jgi:hypothetical protein